jgi:mevalonate pyrophosphate decarboxylase
MTLEIFRNAKNQKKNLTIINKYKKNKKSQAHRLALAPSELLRSWIAHQEYDFQAYRQRLCFTSSRI